ncbi:MAG: hypothetical protein GF344_17085 [Chitinivibrionales bacterium]|nr:hypothetical protein [Chitinivibrionales bacterium]MBD3358397.1 hypothetical protein [Chitinivibrionales bacterium]
MEEAIRACEELFRVPRRVARVILPSIRARDVKAAAPGAVAELRKHTEDDALSRTRMIKRVIHARRALLKHIERREGKQRRGYAPAWGSDVYYWGDVVPRTLRLGQYLYYRGAISRRMLDDALEWQKRKRPMTGQIALRYRMISPRQFALLLYMQNEYALFGEAAKAHGILDDKELKKIFEAQKRYQCRIGDYFVQMGVIPRERMDDYHNDLCEHNMIHAA